LEGTHVANLEQVSSVNGKIRNVLFKRMMKSMMRVAEGTNRKSFGTNFHFAASHLNDSPLQSTRQMLPTPSTSHVCFDNVYEPAEDSFLLLDTLSGASEVAFLSQRFPKGTPAPFVVEVGTGSGVVLAFVTAHSKSIFGRKDVLTLGTDINSFASTAAAKTVENARREQLGSTVKSSLGSAIFSDTVIADLATPLRYNMVDVMIFNPPYVPTDELPNLANQEHYNSHNTPATKKFERDSHLLALSYAGGLDGMETTNRLIEQLPNILRHRSGVAYLLLCAQNKPTKVKENIRAWGNGWKAETIGHSGKQGGWEKLQILRTWQECQNATNAP
jgi:release factor glutamine methyltransferase